MSVGLKDETGKIYGRLTVVRRAPARYGTSAFWECLCLCGQSSIVKGVHLRRGLIVSCGCRHWDGSCAKTHGHCVGRKRTREYSSWVNMLVRCYNKKARHFKYYGGRGITVCERWRRNFQNFFADMGNCPIGLTLERIDNNGNYEPGNCKWDSYFEQRRNRRDTRFIEFNGRVHTMCQWSGILGIRSSVISDRLRLGWSVDRALTQPVNKAMARPK